MKSLLFLLAILSLTACTIKNKEQVHSPTTPYLIIEEVDSLHNLKSKPLTKKIENKKEIEELITLLSTLPEFPKSIIHCPMDNGIKYDLKFKNIFNDKVVTLSATGCRQVNYDNKVYWAIDPQGRPFRTYLLHLLDMSESEFTGST